MRMRHAESSCTELCKYHYDKEFKFYKNKNKNCQMKDAHSRKVQGRVHLSFEDARQAFFQGKFQGRVFPDMCLCNACNNSVKEEISKMEWDTDSPDLISVSQQSNYSEASSVKRLKTESILSQLNDLLKMLDISTVKDKDQR